jgi:hypothetical protein
LGVLPVTTAAAITLGAVAVLPQVATAAAVQTYRCTYGTLASDVATAVSLDTDAPATTEAATPLALTTSITLTMPHSVVTALEALPGFTSVAFKAVASTDGVSESYVAPDGRATPVIAHPALKIGTADSDGNVPFTGRSPAPNRLDGASALGTYAITTGAIAYEMDVNATTPTTERLTCTPTSSTVIDRVAVTAPTVTSLAVTGSTWSYGGTTPGATATVVRPNAGAKWPALTGSAQFYADGAPMGAPVPLDATGTAVLDELPPLSGGDHAITASYVPDSASWYTASTSAEAGVTVNVPTTTALSVDPVAQIAGAPATATAKVAAADGSAVPGSVAFRVEGTVIGTAPLHGGTAVLSLPTAASGHREVTAVYAGSGGYQSSSSGTVAVDIGVAPTTTRLRLDRDAAAYGESVAAVASVTSPYLSPVGRVTFTVGDRSLSAPVVGGQARAILPALPPGSYRVAAAFVPASAATFGAGSAAPVGLVVRRDATATRLSVQAVGHGRRLTCVVHVRATHGMPVTGTASVTLRQQGRAVVKRATVVNGVGTARIAKPRMHGAVTVTARYAGSRTFAPSASLPRRLTGR